MEKLEADLLRSRLRFDYQTVMAMSSPLMLVEAYRNIDDLLARRDPITSEADGHLAVHYRVKYHIKTLVGPGRYSESTTVRFDLFANNNYPYKEPVCWVIESECETPWSPHFLEGHFVCIGPIWKRAAGQMLLGELMVHIAKLLNFDEPPYENPDYVGWRGDAVTYWVKTLDRQPISKSLVYPPLPRKVPTPAVNQEPPKVAFAKKQIVAPNAPMIKLRTPPANASPRIKLRTN
jgi:hypothetical protein